jgi:hypothetical protein
VEPILRISFRISSEDIRWTYPRDLSAGLILNSRISRISPDKSGYPDLSGASKFPDVLLHQTYNTRLQIKKYTNTVIIPQLTLTLVL